MNHFQVRVGFIGRVGFGSGPVRVGVRARFQSVPDQVRVRVGPKSVGSRSSSVQVGSGLGPARCRFGSVGAQVVRFQIGPRSVSGRFGKIKSLPQVKLPGEPIPRKDLGGGMAMWPP